MLVAQYIEFAYYGGHNRLDMAGRCRLAQTRSETQKYSVKVSSGPSVLQRLTDCVSRLIQVGRPARVDPADVDEDIEEEDDAGIAYYQNEDGKMVYIDDNGLEVEITQVR